MSFEVMISLVVPAYNEKACIESSVARIHAVMIGCCESFEILVIDDGSTDETWTLIDRISQEFSEVKGLRLSRNFGKEHAICAGMDEANGNAVILLDADMQHPPEFIPQMIQCWRDEDIEIVECVKSKRGKESLPAKACAHMFYGLMGHLSGIDFSGASDFKLLDKKVVEAWRSMGERNVFFRGMSAWVGFSRKQIEFEVADRHAGHSKWTQWSLFSLALKGITAFSTAPLRVVMVSGLLFCLFAFVLAINTLHQYIIGEAVSGFSTVILLILVVSSLIMLALGIIGEYIARIYEEVKGRPRYIISKRC